MSSDPPNVQLDAFETKTEASAAVDRALERDRAAVRLRDVLHDREAQARSGKLPRVVRTPEAVEHARHVLPRDTRAVITHGDLAVRDGHLDGGARGAVLPGVV